MTELLRQVEKGREKKSVRHGFYDFGGKSPKSRRLNEKTELNRAMRADDVCHQEIPGADAVRKNRQEFGQFIRECWQENCLGEKRTGIRRSGEQFSGVCSD